MNEAPAYIDGGKVLYWAWSGEEPFGIVPDIDGKTSIDIFGLAIVQYEETSIIYRFSCNENWETVQDIDYRSVEEAMSGLPAQYKNKEAFWNKC